MTAPPAGPNPAPILATILRESAARLNYEPQGTAAVLFNGLRNAGWTEEDILSALRFESVPPLRLRHPQPTARGALTSARHVGQITRAVFTVDGHGVVSCSDAGEIIRWPLTDGHPAFAIHGHIGAITQCEVFLNSLPSGTPPLLTAGADRCARLWDAATGELLAEMSGHDGAVLCLAVSPAGDRALTGSADGTLRLWNLEHGTTMAVLKGHGAAVTACAFVPAPVSGDTNEMVSGSADGMVIQWTDWNVRRRFDGHTARVTSVGVSPRLDVLVTTADDCTVRVWDLSSGKQRSVLTGHILGVNGCIFLLNVPSPMIVSWSLDRTIRRWDIESGKPVGEPLRHDAAVEGCVTREARRLLSWSADATVRTWDWTSGEELARVEERSAFQAADAEGDRLVAATARGTLRTWNLDGLTPQRTLCSAESVSALIRPHDFRPGGFWTETNVIVVADELGEIDVATGDLGPLLMSKGASDAELIAGALAGDGSRLLVWSNAAAQCFELESRPPYVEWSRSVAIDGAVVTGNGARAIVWRADTLLVWNLETSVEERTIVGHTGPISACVLIDADHAWSASLDGTLRLWDLRTGQEVRRFEGHSGRLLGWYLTPQFGLSWSDDKSIRVWDLVQADAGPSPSDAAVLDVPGTITAVASTGVGTGRPGRSLSSVVLGTSDGRLISFPPRQPPRYTRLHTHRIRDIVYMTEAEAFACCSDDGTVRLWRNGEAVAGAVFYTSSPVVRLMAINESLVALDEHGQVSVLAISIRAAGTPA